MYVFYERVIPIIPDIAKTFDIYILLTPTHSYIVELLLPTFEKWEANGTIVKAYIGPKFTNTLFIYYYLNKITKDLKKVNFDIWVTNFVSFPELYIYHNIMPKTTFKVALSTNTTTLNFHLSNFGIKESEYKEKLKIETLSELMRSSQNKKKLNRSVIVQIKRKSKAIVPMILNIISIKLLKGFYKNKYIFNELNSSINSLTIYGHNIFDEIVFQTEMEVEAHRILFNSVASQTKCSVVDFSIDNCTCDVKVEKKGVLFATTAFVNEDDSPNEYKISILKSLESIQDTFGMRKFYFRKHPAENGQWVNKLAKYLNESHIEAYVLNEEYQPLRKVVCDYEMVVSDGSASLRDVIFDCKNVLSIVLEKPASYAIKNPKLFFANTDRLSWINKEYIYEPNIIDNKSKVTVCNFLINYNDKIRGKYSE